MVKTKKPHIQSAMQKFSGWKLPDETELAADLKDQAESVPPVGQVGELWQEGK